MYGEERNWRYFIGFGVLIVLLFVVIVLIMRHGNGSKGEVPETERALTSYVNDSSFSVTETIIGPVSAAQTHDQIQISVSNRSTDFALSKGYDENVVNSKSYDMTPTSFSEFLSALDKAGFTKGNTDPTLKDDKGYCPNGQRYIFEAKDGSQTIERFWATSCKSTKTYKGNLGLTTDLFQAQVPDYVTLTNDTNFGSSLLGL